MREITRLEYKAYSCLHFCFSVSGKEPSEKSNLAVANLIYIVYSLLTLDISRLLLVPFFLILVTLILAAILIY